MPTERQAAASSSRKDSVEDEGVEEEWRREREKEVEVVVRELMADRH